MPTCKSESLSKLLNHHNDFINSNNSENNSGPSSPMSTPISSPPLVTSPQASSPTNTLRRRNKPMRRTWSSSSTNSLIQEPFIIQSDVRQSGRSSQRNINILESNSLLVKIIGWYPLFLLRIVQIIFVTLSEITLTRILLALPTLWFHLWVIFFWKIIQLPLMVLKYMFAFVHTPSSEQFKKKTVLISCGSTIQALHLARNFYSAGANVIVCEIEGIFSFTQFSTAVSKFYTLPYPSVDNYKNYIKTICNIVQKENVQIYVPVSITTPAYYDAFVKPHLELMGCICYCPGVKEVWILDDPLELMRRCQTNGIATPLYYHVTSKSEIMTMYDEGILRTGHFTMIAAGLHGIQERIKYELPSNKNDLRIIHEVSPEKPWVIIQNVSGEHYLTCTTIKDSNIIANVTCKLADDKAIIPVENKEITQWIRTYFSKLKSLRPITGHVGFRFVISDITGNIIPIGLRTGVSLPYICHTSIHSRELWKPCRHFNRQSSSPILLTEKNDKILNGTLVKSLLNDKIPDRLYNCAIDKRDALFMFWDPLPYCVYYHMQLPLKNIVGLVKQRREQEHHITRTLAAPVH